MVFLGIALDSIAGIMELPGEKLTDLKDCLQSFVGRSRATKVQLQALAGKSNWACQEVRGGRTFLHHILDNISHLHQPQHKRKLSREFHEDIRWLLTF